MQGFAHVDCAAEVSKQNRQASGFRSTAPVSHQKQPHQSATNAIEIEQKRSKINEADRYSAAHNGLVAGLSPTGPASNQRIVEVALDHCTRNAHFGEVR